MSLTDLAVLYLLAGLACAVAVYRAAPLPGARAVAAAALAVPLWPLWAPIALTERQRPRARDAGDRDGGAPSVPSSSPVAAAAARIDAALREAVDACAGTALESLLPRAAADRIAAEVRRAADRHAELSALVGREGFDLAAAEARVRALTAREASPRAVSTASLHLDNVRRLLAMRDRDALALDELADLVQALRAQLVLARFAGSRAEGAGGIVSEVWARVEGLGVALDVDLGVEEGA